LILFAQLGKPLGISLLAIEQYVVFGYNWLELAVVVGVCIGGASDYEKDAKSYQCVIYDDSFHSFSAVRMGEDTTFFQKEEMYKKSL